MNQPPSTDRYAVFGNPIAHSLSPQMHTAFAEQTQQAMTYEAQCIDPHKFDQAVDDFFRSGGKGLNITVPFKENAYQLAERISDRARVAKAVNTLYMDGTALMGDNTDGAGFLFDVQTRYQQNLADRSLLILGAGGAARGVLQPIIDQTPSQVFIANRTSAKAHVLAQAFNHGCANVNACGLNELPKQAFDVIINASSASLSGECLHLNSSLIHNNTFCYDMMYSHDLTPFLLWAKQSGCQAYGDGLGMLVGQGAEAFWVWRGVRPDCDSVIEKLKTLLN